MSLDDEEARKQIIALYGKDQVTSKTYIGDTGASCHITNSDEGMFNVKKVNDSVKIGSGKSLRCTKIGSKRMRMDFKDGTSQIVTLHRVKYVPELWVNLFSIGKAIENGFV